ncbi:MAG: L,D-transpeptidase, partial [Actinomycetota bacterium]|nr:L,D-transpeptidase [Actinomycetota bacterium]
VGAIVNGVLENAEAEPTTTTTTVAPTTTTTAPPPVQASTTVVSSATGADWATFDAPNGNQVGTTGTWYGYPMTLPVIDEQPGWYHVRLPERPNGKTAWVRAEDVVTSTTPWRIVISLSNPRLHVYKDGYWQFDMPAGLGKASTKTPPGNYFVAVIERNLSGGYGDPVLNLSAHSEDIVSWQGSGDAIIAIHGQISQSSANRIGTAGTYLSNGCVRLHFADQAKLIDIPVGTPTDIINEDPLALGKAGPAAAAPGSAAAQPPEVVAPVEPVQ